MTATLSTEELLSAALDADPGNHLLRYALADCLEESAGAVECAVCGGDGRSWPGAVICGICCGTGGDGSGYTCMGCGGDGQRHPPAVKCDRCSGTGRVSDGRRERAEGYRVLAQLGRVPDFEAGRWVWWGQGFVMGSGEADSWCPPGSPDSLPWEWRQAVNGDRWEDETNGARYPTRREADDAAALAWGTLPADVRAAILGAGA